MYRWYCNNRFRNNISTLVECIEEGISALSNDCNIHLSELILINTAPFLTATKNQDKTMTIGDIALQMEEVGWCQIRPYLKGKEKKQVSSWVRFETMENYNKDEEKIGKFIQRDLQFKANASGQPQFAYRMNGTRYEAKPI